MSPRTAFLPWPTVSGPVGFALTNSTCARRPAPASERPYASPCSTASRSMRCQNTGARRKLMKPGPAISGGAASQPAGAAFSSSGTSASAIPRGGRPSLRPSTSAALVERSPNSGFAGTSTVNGGGSGERSRPVAMASLSA